MQRLTLKKHQNNQLAPYTALHIPWDPWVTDGTVGPMGLGPQGAHFLRLTLPSSVLFYRYLLLLISYFIHILFFRHLIFLAWPGPAQPSVATGPAARPGQHQGILPKATLFAS